MPAPSTFIHPMYSRSVNRLWIVAIAVFVVLAGLCIYSFIEPYRIEVTQYEYASPQVPVEFDGVTIALVADIHRGRFFSQDRVGDLVERINALEPDIIALAGDYVYADTKYERSCFAELSKLKARLGSYAVLGNHDYGEDLAQTTQAVDAIEDSGIELLDDRATWISEGDARIRIGGVGDYQVGRPDLAPTLDGATGDDLVILLSHNPDYAETLRNNDVDLVLSGHTHGGQLTFFGLFAPYLPSDYGQKYRTGEVKTDNTTVIVTNGIGSSIILPVRFFARPQIVEVTLRHTASTD